jgi:hypothetical protein
VANAEILKWLYGSALAACGSVVRARQLKAKRLKRYSLESLKFDAVFAGCAEMELAISGVEYEEQLS